ncbi:SulP family inorganic anion transporter [Lujinxingia vulgaris]|uniref:SulP family inorganic anion transporter n=1 Tax=Lujinxingia vulgaris TaxID=2600176 RepID=A0A5C6XBG0_9DELT|nr:SulP family inorganic anion transporter [Lujinxingia vulgaris]TXD36557.1 SulP family inorganic anion transporter [Lujinxingia vulgaris]
MASHAWLFPTLRQGDRGWSVVWRDALVGLTLWVVMVPEAMAYATIAGVAPVVGLYAAMAALVAYAALGRSPKVVVGPMAATAALSAAMLGALGPADTTEALALTAGLAVASGAAALLAGLLRLGFVVAMISRPVLKGFVVGLSLAVVWGQLPVLLGAEHASGGFFDVLHMWGDVGDWFNGVSAALGVGALVVMLGFRRFAPRVPGAIVAVLVSIGLAWALELRDVGVVMVGALARTPPQVGFPELSTLRWQELIGPALAVALVGFAEAVAAARAVGSKVEGNAELVAQGAANLSAGLVGGMVVNGSLSKSAVNRDAGARTQRSGLVAALLVAITLLWLGGIFGSLPSATLAAVVIAALWELIDFKGLRALYQATRCHHVAGVAVWADAVAAWVTFAGVVLVGVLEGLLVGVGLSLVLMLYRSSWPHIVELGRVGEDEEAPYGDLARHPRAKRVEGVVILRVESGLYFVNADHVRGELRKAAKRPGVRAVILDGESVPVIDMSAAHMLVELAGEFRKQGQHLAIARDIGQVRDLLASEAEQASMLHFTSVVQAVRALARG